MFPALPTGMQWNSGASPRRSTISKAPVFCPSIRNGFTEFTTTTGARFGSSLTTSRATSKLPLTCSTVRPVHERLGQLAESDVALGNEHRAGHPGSCRVGRGGGGSVAGRGADDGLDSLLGRLGDGHRHAPVLERAGRVRSLELEQDVGTDPLREPRRAEQGRPALQEASPPVSPPRPGGNRRYSSITPRQAIIPVSVPARSPAAGRRLARRRPVPPARRGSPARQPRERCG